MGMKSTTFYDPSARRRKLLYLLSFLVVAGSAAAILVLSRGGGTKPGPEKGPRAGTPPGPDAPPAVASAGAGAGPVAPPPVVPADPMTADPARAPLRDAEEFRRTAMDLVKEAMAADSGSADAEAKRAAAHVALLKAQAAYENWLLEHPEDEDALSRAVTEIQQQLFWLRKSMTTKEFGPSSAGSPEVGGAGEADPPRELPARPPQPDRPPAVRTPEFRPADVAARFLANARRLFREGRAEEVAAEGRNLLSDARMEPHLPEIRPVADAAADMAAFLAAVRKDLARRVGETATLALRRGDLSGVIVSTEPELVIRTGDGERKVPVRDLSGRELLARAEAAGHLAGAGTHLAAGSYLILRGDGPEGVRELLLAKAGGADVSAFEDEMKRHLAGSPELKALAGWLAVSPLVGSDDPQIVPRLKAFRTEFRDTSLFAERRESIFRAESAAAGRWKFGMEMLFRGAPKVGSRGQVLLAWSFDSEEELGDFGLEGKWEVSGGALRCDRGFAWVERFDLREADVSLDLPEGGTVTFGFWERGNAARQGVNLTVSPVPEGLLLSLKHGDRTIQEETVQGVSGTVSIGIQKKEEKYQVRVGKKIVLKATDHTGRDSSDLHAVGVMAMGERIAVGTLEVASSLDLEWAKAGGEKYGGWIDAWFVTGPFAIDPKDMAAGLADPRWPETRPFDPSDRGEGGAEPAWKFTAAVTGWLDLNRLFRVNDGVAAYGAARLWSPDRRPALLEVVVDELACAWMNGELAAREVPLAKAVRVPVRLEPGDNVLLLKVIDDRQGWWARARLLTKAGEPMPDVLCW